MAFWRPDLEAQSRAEWEELQLRLLRGHVDEAYRGSPYYRSAFDRAGDHLDHLTIQIERAAGNNPLDEELAHEFGRQIKSVAGVSADIRIFEPNPLPRATHKAKRVDDRRTGVALRASPRRQPSWSWCERPSPRSAPPPRSSGTTLTPAGCPSSPTDFLSVDRIY